MRKLKVNKNRQGPHVGNCLKIKESKRLKHFLSKETLDRFYHVIKLLELQNLVYALNIKPQKIVLFLYYSVYNKQWLYDRKQSKHALQVPGVFNTIMMLYADLNKIYR